MIDVNVREREEARLKALAASRDAEMRLNAQRLGRVLTPLLAAFMALYIGFIAYGLYDRSQTKTPTTQEVTK